MASLKPVLFFSSVFLFFLFPTFAAAAAAEPCGNYRFDEGKTFASCTDLPSLNCSLHWNYDISSHTVEVAFRRSGLDDGGKSRWMAWAINPDSKGMIGSQALVAFVREDGSTAAYTSPVTSYATQLQQGELSFPVKEESSSVKDNEMIIFATLTLPKNVTTVNHLWQEGPMVGRNVPGMHRLSGANVGSMGTLDFLSGKISVEKTSSRNNWKIVHGVLCTLGWGLLMPVGALIARHGKRYLQGPAWFYVHVICQCTAYVLGLAGGIIGILLWKGVFGVGIQAQGSHPYIGMTLLVLGLIQGIVGFRRPDKEAKRRIYFNWFHYLMGYGSIGLSMANVFLGFNIIHLRVSAWPQLTYIASISFLVSIALILEGVRCWTRNNASTTTMQDEIVA